jgi:hypothetical protein
MNDSDRLETMLLALGTSTGPDVDLVPGVLARLSAAPADHDRSPTPARRRVIGLAIAAALVLAGCVAAPPVRHALVDLFNFGGIVVREDDGSPTTPSGSSDPNSYLGAPTTVAALEVRTKGRLLVPAELGDPSAAYVRDALVTLVWGTPAEPDWVVMEVVEPSRPVLEKIVHNGQGVREVTVHGQAGVWVPGPQELFYIGSDGESHFEAPRVPRGATLIWEEGGVTVRIESRAGFTRTAGVADSMR